MRARAEAKRRAANQIKQPVVIQKVSRVVLLGCTCLSQSVQVVYDEQIIHQKGFTVARAYVDKHEVTRLLKVCEQLKPCEYVPIFQQLVQRSRTAMGKLWFDEVTNDYQRRGDGKRLHTPLPKDSRVTALMQQLMPNLKVKNICVLKRKRCCMRQAAHRDAMKGQFAVLSLMDGYKFYAIPRSHLHEDSDFESGVGWECITLNAGDTLTGLSKLIHCGGEGSESEEMLSVHAYGDEDNSRQRDATIVVTPRVKATYCSDITGKGFQIHI